MKVKWKSEPGDSVQQNESMAVHPANVNLIILRWKQEFLTPGTLCQNVNSNVCLLAASLIFSVEIIETF